MSAVALMLNRRGFRVRGTDLSATETTDMLRAMGVEVFIGHGRAEPEVLDAIVVSDAIDLDRNEDVLSGRELGCPIFRRSQVLGWLLRGKRVIAVTGTHGKTTVTGMIGAGLLEAYIDPTIVVGAEVPEFGGAVIEGDGDWAVVEACEAYDSFHDIEPTVVVLTNLEPDHLDFHGQFENLQESTQRFIETIPADGALIYCHEDKGACEIAERVNVRKLPYDANTFGTISNETSTGENPITAIVLAGVHNRRNSGGALLAVQETHASAYLGARGISRFRGANRRLQVLREGEIAVVDDYAHHPTEINATLEALRERYPDRRLIVVFQPHLYSRTQEHLKEFAKALDRADVIVLTDIYPAREAPIPGVSSARIAEIMIQPAHYVPQRKLLPRKVRAIARSGDVVVGMGAGNISEFAPAFLEELDGVRDEILVVYGGDSAEREVSLISGNAVASALKEKRFEVRLVDVSELLATGADLSHWTGPNRPRAAFLAVHGTHAEDGAIQGFFELLHIPYTGSGLRSSAVAMDKHLAKQLFASAGISVPFGVLVRANEIEGFLQQTHALPLIVKPNAQGSTIGLSFVTETSQLEPAIQRALLYDREAIVEEAISGIEISVPVIERDGVATALPAVEIAARGGNYDFEAKYSSGLTEEIIPARIGQSVSDLAAATAIKCHKLLGCRGATRTDMIVRDDVPFVLELNTIPGMTQTSLLPNSARAAGISFENLCEIILEEALARDA